MRPVVVAPTFNHATPLSAVLAKVEALGHPIIVVNDGSSDTTAALLAQWAAGPRGVTVHVVTHAQNQGKAAALRSGFAEAMKLGFTHAVTIDTDGQHDAADVPALLTAAEREPYALVLGERGGPPGKVPWNSLWGRRMANLGVLGACGLRLSDSQCGLRVYPMELVRLVPCKAGRYAFESEIIIRAAWGGWPVVRVPVREWYPPKGQRTSHFKVLRDTLHGVGMQLKLQMREVLPFKHRRTCPIETTPRRTMWQRVRDLIRSMSPKTILAQLRQDQVGKTSLAASLAVGAFIANLPVYPLQTAIALYVGTRLHLQPLAVVAGSLLSTPPIGPILIALAIGTGHLILHGSAPDLSGFDLTTLSGVFAVLKRFLLDWAVGSLVVGFTVAVATFVLASMALAKVRQQDGGEVKG